MKSSRSRTGNAIKRATRTRSRTTVSRKPTLDLRFLSETLDPRVVFARASAGTRYNNCAIPEQIGANLPRFDYDPASVTGYNLMTNSQWTGGGVNVAPAGWVIPASGNRQPNGAIGDSVVYRFTAVSQRPFIQMQTALTLAVGDVRINSVYIGAIYSGSVALSNMCNWVNSGGAGNQTWFVDGVETVDTALVTANTRVSVRIVCTTAGALMPRGGPGCGAVCTVDMDCSRPAVHAAYLPLAYYSTTLTGPLGNGTIRGVLMEEQRTNLIANSETSAWVSNTPNDARPGSFFGTFNGTVLVKGSVQGDDPNKQAASGTLPAAGTSLAGSILIDLATATGASCAVTLLWFDADGVQYIRVQVTTSNGIAGTSTTGANATMTRWNVRKLYGTVWQVSIVGTFSKVATSQPRLYVSPGPNNGEKLVVGCAQLEIGSQETSYIPTTSAQVTRANDEAHVLYSSMGYRNNAGTFAFEGYQPPILTPGRIAINSSLDLAERRALSVSSSGVWAASANTGGNFASFTGANAVAGALTKAALAYSGPTASLAADGGVVYSGALFQPTASDRVRFGGHGSAAVWNAPVRALRYWPRCMAGPELKAITT